MPDFTAIQARLDSVHKATALLDQLKAIYGQSKTVQGSIALYQAGTDTDFNNAIDSIFVAGERTELNQMLTQVEALIADWEANHGVLLGL